MVLLPAQLARLARVAANTGGAVGITKIENNLYEVRAGTGAPFLIGPDGQNIQPRNQERLC